MNHTRQTRLVERTPFPERIWSVTLAAIALAVLAAGCTNRGERVPPLPDDVQARRRAAIVAQATQMEQKLVEGDLDGFIGYLDPELVGNMGGPEELKKRMAPELAQMTQAIEQMTIGEVSEVCRDGDRLVALFPVSLHCRTTSGTVIQVAYRIACSRNDGASWTFMEGQGRADQEDLFRRMFPVFTRRVPFPVCKVEKLQKPGDGGPENPTKASKP